MLLASEVRNQLSCDRRAKPIGPPVEGGTGARLP
jgi:hypothetical protein